MYEYRASVKRLVGPLTVRCVIDLGYSIHMDRDIRLAHLEQPAPDKRQETTAAVQQWLSSHDPFTLVSIEDRREKFGRFLGVFVGEDGTVLNEMLLEVGLVTPYGPGPDE